MNEGFFSVQEVPYVLGCMARFWAAHYNNSTEAISHEGRGSVRVQHRVLVKFYAALRISFYIVN